MKDLGMLRRAGWLGWPGWSGWWLGAVVLGIVLPVHGQYGGMNNVPLKIVGGNAYFSDDVKASMGWFYKNIYFLGIFRVPFWH